MPVTSPSAQTRVLLVGWDSADWKMIQPLVDGGQMPAMRRILETGVSGNLRTLEPMLSPMLWTSIATGKQAYDHGVAGFTEVDPLTQTIRPVISATRRCHALWNILASQGLKAHVIGWFATHGEQIPGGSVVSNLFPVPTAGPGEGWPPAPPGTIWPESLADAMNPLRVTPEDIDGDTIGLFCPRWAEVDLKKDPRLGHLRMHLAEAFSIQAAACHTLSTQDWHFVGVYFRAIDEIAHHFMPYHPPRLPGLPQEMFDLYSEVMNGVYRIHDFMLARLMALAGPDTHVIVVSDHGFHSDHLRPRFVPKIPAGITVWHREHGMIAAAGPRFARDALVHGAGLLDVAPTILHLFDLPVGADMEGRVRLDAMVDPPPVRFIPTWETEFKRPPAPALTAEEGRMILEQFAALGYVERPTGDVNLDAAVVRQENSWSLARSLMHGLRHDRALPLLESLSEELPERVDIAQALARCQSKLGLVAEAAETLDRILETASNAPVAALMRAQIALERRDPVEALRWVETARQSLSQDPRFWRQLGFIQIELRAWPEAQSSFDRLVELAPEDAAAYLGLAITHLHQHRLEDAVRSALQSTALEFNQPRTHFVLARALLRLRDIEKAEKALRTALAIAPTFPQARQLLSAICRFTGRHGEALEHQTIRLSVLSRREAHADRVRKLREESSARYSERRQSQTTAPPNAAADSTTPAPESTPEAPGFSRKTFVVVSGLPRSGTSLMMQMLARGGLPPMTDGVRAADAGNEEGYFEWELIRQLPRNPRLIEQAEGRAVKVVSALVASLPQRHRYKLIWMQRPILEVARSQHKMRFGIDGNPAALQEITESLARHAEVTLQCLRAAPWIELLEMPYAGVIRDPAAAARRLADFLGPDLLPNPSDMPAAVKPALHRQRGEPMSGAESPQ